MLVFQIPPKDQIDPNIELGTPDNPNYQVVTLANFITVLRMLLTCVFLYMFVTGKNRNAALAVYAIAATTDWVDGQIARRTKTVSWYGKILDPICDRFLLFTGVLGLVLRGELPSWIAVFLIGRDIYLAIGAHLLQKYRLRPVDVVYVGKVTTAFLMFGFSFMLLGMPVLDGFGWVSSSALPLLNSTSAPFGILLVYIGCVLSFITAVEYTKTGIKIKQESKDDK